MWFLVFISILGGTPYGDSPASADAYLQALQARELPFAAAVAEVARDGVGTTYSDGPLGEGPDAQYDPDPLIDLGNVDCVTYVEQCLALAAGMNIADTTEKLQAIRYAGGVVDFGARNHFMIADWVANNPWCVDKTAALGLPVKPLTRSISKRDFFERVKAPELGSDTADRDVTISYIPSGEAGRAAAAITTPSVIVFVGKIDWLFALHCGLFVPDGRGGGRLYHASSKAGKVVAVDLGAYVASQSKRYLGFTVYEITPPPFAPAAAARRKER